MKRIGVTITLAAFLAAAALAQSQPVTPDSGLVHKAIRAVSYQVGGGSTDIDLNPTGAVAGASGQATVQAKQGVTNIEVSLKGMTSPTKLGAEFLTYVLWVVSPDGRFNNVGEIQPDNSGQAKLKATAATQTFSLFVTAEPYFAVRQPSEIVVLVNDVRKNTKGKIVVVDDYKLMRRSQYEKLGNPLALTLDLKNVPLEVYEARNAVEIAKSRAADKYAPEIFSKADGGLKLTENALARKTNKKDIISTARMAVQSSEDARALAVQRQEEERIANEKAAAAAQAKADAEAKAAAEAAEAKRKADAEAAEAKRKADAEAAEARRRADEEAKRQAEMAAAREAQLKAENEAAALKSKMEADALKAKEEAAKAEAERARQATEALRAQLLGQLNRILETKDTPRGLVVTMADVLFATGKYDLKPATREKLAQLSGIILAHQGLMLRIEGYTDSTGSDEFNQKLSEQRSATVRDYLVQQGLPVTNVNAIGFGKANPVADNSTASGRQQNRRVEIVLSGEVIGVKIDQ
ncbi:MAG TPA: OmpA family protein [Candidatus Acidoferrales bacterium]|nr:OmpA family protein [Candidatus Acidoferrales bacterium]